MNIEYFNQSQPSIDKTINVFSRRHDNKEHMTPARQFGVTQHDNENHHYMGLWIQLDSIQTWTNGQKSAKVTELPRLACSDPETPSTPSVNKNLQQILLRHI